MPLLGHRYTVAPGYLRTAQVAEILQVSPKTVSRWVKEGKLPYRRTLGGHARFSEETIRDLLAANTFTPDGEATP